MPYSWTSAGDGIWDQETTWAEPVRIRPALDDNEAYGIKGLYHWCPGCQEIRIGVDEKLCSDCISMLNSPFHYSLSPDQYKYLNTAIHGKAKTKRLSRGVFEHKFTVKKEWRLITWMKKLRKMFANFRKK